MLPYSDYQHLIEQAINNIDYPEQPAGLYEPIKYTMASGGKRLRPVLTLATANALGCDPEKAVYAALAVEMFHNFTLLHDDIMDRAEVRRGRPTVHVKWNDSTAILSGDAMLTMASMILSNAGMHSGRFTEMNRLFNRTAMEVYEGQQYDMDFEQRMDVTESEYIEMIRLKTSVLLGCACRMGAIAADASPRAEQAFYNYGVKLGLAFQLRDDYLDTYGTFETFGKEPGGDILNEKKTWLSIAAMADERSCAIRSIFGSQITDGEKIERVRALYDRAELPRRINELIAAYSDEADKELMEIGLPQEALDFFLDLTQKMTRRAK